MRFTGQVLDTAGSPLYGASVYVLNNMNNGVSANSFGQFSLNVNPGEVIRFSFVGYTPVDIVAKSEAPVTVVLTNNQELDELVIDTPFKPEKNSSLLWVFIGFVGVVTAAVLIGKSDNSSEPKKVNV